MECHVNKIRMAFCLEEKMKQFVKEKVMSHMFLIAVILTAIVKQVLIHGLTIYAIPAAACDDQLMRDWAYSLSRLEWTGPFTSYIFLKDPGFSFYLAVCYRLHLSYIMTTTLLYSIAAIVFAYAIKKVIKKSWVVYIVYIFVLFNPVSFSLQTLQRVYRNGFALALTLFFVGCLLNFYFTLLDKNTKIPMIWSVLSGLSIGYLWVTKNDTIWLLPLTLVVMVISAGILVFKMRNKKSIPRYVMLLTPIIGIMLFSGIKDYFNVQTYGYKGVEYYGPAISDITGYIADDATDTVSISRKSFKKLCDVSPTLNSIWDEMQDKMDVYGVYDTAPDDGNVDDGWFGWALVDAVKEAGYYDGCKDANEFYKAVYGELEDAYVTGEISKKQETTMQKYHLDTGERRQELFSTIKTAIQYMASFNDANAVALESEYDGGLGVWSFENLTNDNALYRYSQDDFYVEGWLLFTDYDMSNMQVYIEDNAGNQYTKVNFIKSKDVVEAVKDKGDYPWADKCRYKVSWNKLSENSETDYYFVAYQEGKTVGKVKILQGSYENEDNVQIYGNEDIYYTSDMDNAKYDTANSVINRLNMISTLYQKIGLTAYRFGFFAYAVITCFMIYELTKKRYDLVNPWLVITGLFLSVVVLCFGIAKTQLDETPAINYMYLSSGYALLIASWSISIVKMFEIVIEKLILCKKEYLK